jgi:site-specific recombinase XerC
MLAPKVGRLILPSLTQEQVKTLLVNSDNIRDKAIIALFTESGLRLSELTNIMPNDIDWQHRLIKVMGKGRKEAYAPFGELSAGYLRAWLVQYKPEVISGDSISGALPLCSEDFKLRLACLAIPTLSGGPSLASCVRRE